MKRLSVSLLAAAAVLLGCHDSGAAQPAKTRAKREPYDWHKYDNDPCGDPRAESGVAFTLRGKVVSVPAGDRLVIDVAREHGRAGRRGVVVQLIGIEAPAPGEPFGRESQQLLESLALGRTVHILTKLELAFRDKLPDKIAGVVHLRADPHDPSLAQVSAGLARHQVAEPYTMSNYRDCQYRRAEGAARAARRGLWRQSGAAK